MKPSHKCLVVMMLLTLPGVCGAENLRDAWADVVLSHQQLAAAQARRDAAAYDVDSARDQRVPRLDITGSFTQLDDAPGFDLGGQAISQPLFSNDNFATAGIQVSVPLYAGGSITAGIKAAEYAAAASEGQLGATLQDIKLGTAEHFIQVLRAESALAVAESNVAALEAQTKAAKSRYEFGKVPRNDFLSASVSLSNAQQRELQAENALDNARAAYNRYMGRPLDRSVELNGELDIDQLIPQEHDLDSLVQLALQGREELASLQSQSDSLRQHSSAVRGKSLPQLALTGGYMYQENEFLTDDQFWAAGVSLQWNLFNGGRNKDRAAALDLQAAAVGHMKNDLTTTIALQVRRAWNDRKEAESRTIVTESAVELATENLRMVRNRYEAGTSINTEVLDAESLRQQALNNRDDAIYELALAKLRLARAVGLL